MNDEKYTYHSPPAHGPLDLEWIALEEDIAALTDYFIAALEGNESKSSLRRMWKQETDIIRSRRRKPECGACTGPEPVFGILLSELSEWEKENLCWSEVQDLQQRIRARGPVQQAPVIISVEPHPPGAEQLRCDNTCPARTPVCEETCPLAQHDAALIAEDRKRPRPPCEECIYQAQAAQAREDVLDEPHINQYLERIRKSSIALKDEKLKTIISVALSIAADHYESLRHGQGREPE